MWNIQVSPGLDINVFVPVNIGQAAFESMVHIVQRVHSLLKERNDHHGRNMLLASFIQYLSILPHSGPLHTGLCTYTVGLRRFHCYVQCF